MNTAEPALINCCHFNMDCLFCGAISNDWRFGGSVSILFKQHTHALLYNLSCRYVVKLTRYYTILNAQRDELFVNEDENTQEYEMKMKKRKNMKWSVFI